MLEIEKSGQESWIVTSTPLEFEYNERCQLQLAQTSGTYCCGWPNDIQYSRVIDLTVRSNTKYDTLHMQIDMNIIIPATSYICRALLLYIEVSWAREENYFPNGNTM